MLVFRDRIANAINNESANETRRVQCCDLMNLNAGGCAINTVQRLCPCPCLLARGARESDDEKLRPVRQIVRVVTGKVTDKSSAIADVGISIKKPSKNKVYNEAGLNAAPVSFCFIGVKSSANPCMPGN